MKMYALTAAFILACLTCASAGTPRHVYYIQPGGNDSNTGLGQNNAQAWQTLVNVRTRQFNPGDSILLQGGQTFSDYAVFSENNRGNAKSLLTLASYGTGNATISSTTHAGFTGINNAGLLIGNINFVGNGINTGTQPGVWFYNNQHSDSILDTLKVIGVNVSQYGGQGILANNAAGFSGYKNILFQNDNVSDVAGYNGTTFNGYAGAAVDSEYNPVTQTSDYYSKGQGYTYGTTQPVFQNVTFDHLTVNRAQGFQVAGGMFMQGVQNGTIQYSISNDIGDTNAMSTAGPVGIYQYDGSHYLSQFNESYDTFDAGGFDGNGLTFDAGTSDSVMQYDYSHDNGGYGLYLSMYADTGWNGHAMPGNTNNTVRYNITQNNESGSGQSNYSELYFDDGGTGQITGNFYYGNSSYTSTPSAGPVLSSFCAAGCSNTFYNNILMRSTAGLMAQVSVVGTLTLQHNNYYNTAAAFSAHWVSTTYSTYATWQTATGEEEVMGVNVGQNVNPLFTSPGTAPTTNGYNPSLMSAYKLLAASPMIGSGVDLSGINPGPVDYYGNPTPGVHGWSLGAYSPP